MFTKNYVSVNKITTKSKKTFVTRTLSALFIFLFLLLSLSFSILSDKRWGWSGNVGPITNIVFAYAQLFLMLILIIYATIEITNLHFYKNKMAIFITFISIAVYVYMPTLFYFSWLYHGWIITEYDLYFVFIIAFLVCLFGVLLVNSIYFWTQGLLEFKKVFIHLTLVCLISILISGWLYFSFLRGWTTLLLLYGITAFTDSYAYLGGMFFGKKKMSPYISPNKTIGGGIIGVAAAVITCLIIMSIFSTVPDKYNVLENFFGIKFRQDVNLGGKVLFADSWLWWITITAIFLVLSVTSVAGDLSFSYIKRMYKIKDYSNLIPGHGGFLDRLDSSSFVVGSYFIFTLIISFFSVTSSLF